MTTPILTRPARRTHVAFALAASLAGSLAAQAQESEAIISSASRY